jgi:hypothetical protein
LAPDHRAVDLCNKKAQAEAIQEAHGESACCRKNGSARIPHSNKKFSRMVQEMIDAFRAQRLEGAEYLRPAMTIMESVLARTGDDVPNEVAHNENTKAYYGSIVQSRMSLNRMSLSGDRLEDYLFELKKRSGMPLAFDDIE